jgi:hypothetical protein
MNDVSEFPMLQEALMKPQFISLHIPESNASGCIFKMTVTVLKIIKLKCTVSFSKLYCELNCTIYFQINKETKKQIFFKLTYITDTRISVTVENRTHVQVTFLFGIASEMRSLIIDGMSPDILYTF